MDRLDNKLIKYFTRKYRINKAIDREYQMSMNSYFMWMDSHNKKMYDSVEFWKNDHKKHQIWLNRLKGLL